MSELPTAELYIPEIIFVGRSNVGKSSLVNFILQRKQLASTSAVPGHTTHFNFYTINEPLSSRDKTTPTTSTTASSTTTAILDSCKAPTLRFVDVPGMGYSESTTTKDDSSSDRVHSRNKDSSSNVYGGKYSNVDKKDTPDSGNSNSYNSTSTTSPTTTSTTTSSSSKKDYSKSWRGLLHRYFTVRDSLSLVFHLIDARQGVTAVDDEIINMLNTAQHERIKQQKPLFRIVFIFTKTDQITTTELSMLLLQIEAKLKRVLNLPSERVTLLATSVLEKRGFEDIWEIIYTTTTATASSTNCTTML